MSLPRWARTGTAGLLVAAWVGARVAVPPPADAAINCSVYVCATLTVSLLGDGDGSFVSTDGFIDCRRIGGAITGTCKHLYYHLPPLPEPFRVYFTVAAYDGSGACREASCTDYKTSGSVAFETSETLGQYGFQLDRVLTVVKAGSGSGTVVSTGDSSINCGTTCTHAYTHGSSISLKPYTNSGSTFTSWSAPCAQSTGYCIFNIRANTTLTATYTNPSATPSSQPAATPSPTVTPAPATAGPANSASPASSSGSGAGQTPGASTTGVATLAPGATPATLASPGPGGMQEALGTGPVPEPGTSTDTSGIASGPGGSPAQGSSAAGSGSTDLTPIAIALVVAAALLGGALVFASRRRPTA